MLPPGLRVYRVRKGRHGRVHLTPREPGPDAVETLCGKTFEPSTYDAVEAEADCQACRRRQGDPARVSSAFFAAGAGEDLLQAALDAARARRGTPRPVVLPPVEPEPDEAAEAVAPAASRREGAASRPEEPASGSEEPGSGSEPEPEPGASGPEPEPEPIGELDPSGLRRFSESVFHSPQGAIVRLGGADAHLGEIVFDGPVVVRRVSPSRVRVTAGDVVVDLDVSAVEVRLDRGRKRT